MDCHRHNRNGARCPPSDDFCAVPVDDKPEMLSGRGGGVEPQRPNHLPDVPGVSSDAVLDELERLLSSEVVLASPQLCRFLRFIVEQEIAGKGGELKEYSLGVQVFRKPDSFDPRVDNVVRT